MPIYPTDIFEPIEITDIPKYLNHLTDAGTHFLKGIKE